MCVHVCVCVCVCTCMCVCVCTCVCMCVHTCVCLCVCVCTCLCMSVHTCVCVCVHICVCAHMCVCVCKCVSLCAALPEATGGSDRGADKPQKAIHGRHVTPSGHHAVADLKLYEQWVKALRLHWSAMTVTHHWLYHVPNWHHWCCVYPTGILCTQLTPLVQCVPSWPQVYCVRNLHHWFSEYPTVTTGWTAYPTDTAGAPCTL